MLIEVCELAYVGCLTCTVCRCFASESVQTRVHNCDCVCGGVSGIKKPSHRQSPAVNETGPDVGSRGG